MRVGTIIYPHVTDETDGKLRLGDFPEVTHLVIGERAIKRNPTCFQSLPCELLHHPAFQEALSGVSAPTAGAGGRAAMELSRSGMDGQR